MNRFAKLIAASVLAALAPLALFPAALAAEYTDAKTGQAETIYPLCADAEPDTEAGQCATMVSRS